MRKCVFCKTRYEKGSGITFHKFPNGYYKQLWLKNMKMENWSPKSSDQLCNKHFTEDCLIRHAGRITLKKDAVPTIFFEKGHQQSPKSDQSSQQGLFHLNAQDSMITKLVNKPSARDDTVTTKVFVYERAGVKRKMSSIDVCNENTNFDEASTSKSLKKSWTTLKARSVSEVCDNIWHDHRYVNSAKSTIKTMQRVKKNLNITRARVKVLSQHVQRLKMTVSSLKSKITDLKKILKIRSVGLYKLDSS